MQSVPVLIFSGIVFLYFCYISVTKIFQQIRMLIKIFTIKVRTTTGMDKNVSNSFEFSAILPTESSAYAIVLKKNKFTPAVMPNYGIL
ncbi:hypothetical protein HMPREF1987_01237 [Peptostreptococcaceae bacterium oral taxon 113 str. W5053]|nr:hypothetical protein HMPREF1987_01237 [Peptostreptococcaceae bacterium oral taxon 113 str. W5053]